MSVTPEQIAKAGTEYAHQTAFFCWCAANQALHPVLGSKLLFSVGNEEKSGSAIVGMRRKASGCKAGVADVICLWPTSGSHALLVEFKKPGGKQSPEQKIFQAQAEAQNYKYSIVYSWQEGVSTLCGYLGIHTSIDKT